MVKGIGAHDHWMMPSPTDRYGFVFRLKPDVRHESSDFQGRTNTFSPRIAWLRLNKIAPQRNELRTRCPQPLPGRLFSRTVAA
jgi:hypothetical protein